MNGCFYDHKYNITPYFIFDVIWNFNWKITSFFVLFSSFLSFFLINIVNKIFKDASYSRDIPDYNHVNEWRANNSCELVIMLLTFANIVMQKKNDGTCARHLLREEKRYSKLYFNAIQTRITRLPINDS